MLQNSFLQHLFFAKERALASSSFSLGIVGIVRKTYTLFRTIPFYDLTIDRLSGKICTLAHVTSVCFATSKVTKEAEILQEGFSLIFLPCKTFTGQQ